MPAHAHALRAPTHPPTHVQGGAHEARGWYDGHARPYPHTNVPPPAHSPQLVSGGFFFTNSFFLQGGQCHRVCTSPHGQAPDAPTHGHDTPPPPPPPAPPPAPPPPPPRPPPRP